MKRFVLIIGIILLGLALRAQSVTYTCRYWFDQDDAQAVTTTFSEGTWQAELDVGTLINGLHTLHIQAADTSMAWCSPLNYMFIKMVAEEPLLDSVDMSNLTYQCWFDQDHAHQQTGPLGNGSFLFDVADLDEGLHTLNIMLEGSTLTSTQSYMFIKVAQQAPLIEPIDMSHLAYHCWFDQDYENRVVDSVSNGVILLDLDNITDGLHTVHILLEGEALTSTLTYMFLKKPEHQDFGIAKWQYYLNGDVSQVHTTEISPIIDTLDIITLLPVETWPVRSSCFHFHPNGDEPYLNAKNEITFLFWSNDNHLLKKSEFYVDYQVTETIEADTLERNSTVCIAAPRDNFIKWYRLPLEYGDTVAFKTDKACTMQLFAPSGEEVYTATAGEALAFGGCHAYEDGDYYLAVHDVTGSGDEVCLTNVFVHKYAILAHDVHLVGNGGCSTITFQGNGFNSLLDAYLVNYQNDTIHRLDIGHESNTTTTVTFNFYEVNLGVYDAVFQFYDETIRINGALEVQEPVDIVLTSTVSYPTTFLRNTACTYTFTITNEGNMSAYNVPVYVYISTETMYGISRIDIEEFNLQSYYDYVKDIYEWSDIERKNLKEYSDYIGCDHYFVRSIDIGDNGVDSILIRSGNFYLEIPPHETRTITLSITSTSNLDTWMSCPREWEPGIIGQRQLANIGNKSNCIRLAPTDFCCWHSDVEDICNNISNTLSTFSQGVGVLAAATFGLGVASAVAGMIPTPATPVLEGFAALMEMEAADLAALSAATGYTSCLFGGIANTLGEIANNLCDGNLTNRDRFVSWGGLGLSCLGTAIAHLKPALVGNKLQQAMFATGLATTNYSMAHNKKNPECTEEPPKGGKSTPVNSLDPNDIHGYLSESGSHYIRQEIQNVQYEIEFENDTTLATAAAHTIIVRDTLDDTKFDLNSLAARSVTIGEKRLELNGEQNFARTLDMRPELYVIAQIEQDYDPTTGIVEWNIQSLDPMTMEPTDNPYQGVLPVNYYGNGVGFIDYSINLKQAFADGTAISNRSGIIFDQNDVIMTPTWTNIVDAVKPTSHIENAVVEADSLNFSFVSSDNRSGVWYHTLYYRNNSTEQEWQVRKPQIFGNSFMLPIDSLQTTEYLVMAVDSAGNVEEKEMVAEVIVEANVHGFPFFVSGYGESDGGWKLIASPVAGSIEATTVDNIFGATDYDLYYYDQGEASEWRNYKSEPFELENGHGYLYATKEGQTLVFRGTHNEADTFEVMLAYTEDNLSPSKRGWNLIGNPFTVPAYTDRSYYTMNGDGTAIEPNAVSSTIAIPACHGVIVKAEAPGETVIFSKARCWNAPKLSNIQITVTQANTGGASTCSAIVDKAIISFNTNDQLSKFNFNGNAVVCIPQGGKDYAIAYVDKSGEVPVNFKTARNGQYTITLNTDGLELDYLHLIDNLTGADVDLLATSTGSVACYTFEANTMDDACRFRLVFAVSG